MEADASWWGSEAEFDNDIAARLLSDDPAVREEAMRLRAARNARRSQGRNPFAPPPPPAPPPAAPGGPQAADGPEPAPRRVLHVPVYNPPRNAFAATVNPASQGAHFQGMIDQVSDAWAKENDSRVAISREQRRMAHEQQLEAMRTEALLQRLQMEAREREKDRILQKQLATGVTTKKLINGEWVDA